MDRRRFFGTVIGAVVAGLARPLAAAEPEMFSVDIDWATIPTPLKAGDVISFESRYLPTPEGLRFHKDAFSMAMAPLVLDLPEQVAWMHAADECVYVVTEDGKLWAIRQDKASIYWDEVKWSDGR